MQPTYPSTPADGTVQITLLPSSPAPAPIAYSEPSLESFSFKDREGDVFEVTGQSGDEILTLQMTDSDTDEVTAIEFYKADATKIIALIAEAAA